MAKRFPLMKIAQVTYNIQHIADDEEKTFVIYVFPSYALCTHKKYFF